MKNKKSILAVMAVLATLCVCICAFAIVSSAADSEPESRGEINVWLIGGQSNAVGYAKDVTAAQADDIRYFEGFDNVLYYGYSQRMIDEFIPTRLGLGYNDKVSGAELGIAEMLGDTGEMNAIIKYAQGATYLYPNTTASASVNYGTWTSPTYIEKHGISTEGNKTGLMYTGFIETVTAACEELRAMGYTPVIRGMWWMQGEAECSIEYEAVAYEELLLDLMSDVRRDVGQIAGADLSDMPFVFGRIYRNPAYSRPAYIDTVTALQDKVAATPGLNASVVDPADFENCAQIDGWHFDAATQAYLGRGFVSETCRLSGLGIVSAKGANSTVSGGGVYKKGDSVTVKFGAKDGYGVSDVRMSVGGAEPVVIDAANGSYTFTFDGNDTVFYITTEGGSAQTTAYGTIPAEYSAENYPFAVFDGNGFVSAHAYWCGAVNSASGMLCGTVGAGKSATVLLRRDYTTCALDYSSATLTHMNGEFTLDLGGNVMERAAGYLYDIFASATDGVLFTTTIKTVNGTILASNSPIVGLNHSETSSVGGALKHFNMSFEGVTFKVKAGLGKSDGIITNCWENQNYGMTADLTFTDCVYDLTNAAAGSVLINTSGISKSLTYVDVSVIGGKIIAGANEVTLVKTDMGDTFYFDKDSSGAYTVLEAPEGSNISGIAKEYVSRDCVLLTYELKTDNGEFAIYELAEGQTVLPITTPYGDIPAEYASEVNYPIALFNTDNEFLGTYSDMGAALMGAKELGINANYVIYMRTDADMSTKASGLAEMRGGITVDLAGHTLTLTTSNYLLDLYIYNNASATLTDGKDVRGSFSFKNGAIIKNGGYSLICVNYGIKLVNKVQFLIDFENVTISSRNSSKTTAVIVNSWENEGNGTTQNGSECMITDMHFKNCIFDFASSIEGVNMLPMSYATGDRAVFNVTFEGGKIISDKQITSDQIFILDGDSNGRPDTFEFVQNENGEYAILELTAGLSAPLATFNGGTLAFVEDSTADGVTIYKLDTPETVAVPEKTVYGDIPVDYLDKATYPIVVFKADKTFVGGYADLGLATAAAVNAGGANDYYVLLRDNVIQNTKASHYKITGSITVDLNGYTLTKGSTGYLIDVYINNNSSGNLNSAGVDVRGTFVFKNGKIVKNGGNSLFCINYGANLKKSAEIYFVLDNVTISSKTTGTNVLFQTWENGYSGIAASSTLKVTTYAALNNCTLDYLNSSDTAIMFPLLYGSGDRCVFDITVNGGIILAKSEASMGNFAHMNGNANGRADVLRFGKLDGGNYTRLVMPEGMSAPVDNVTLVGNMPYYFTSPNGVALRFVEAAKNEYVLCPTAVVDTGISVKASITLDSSLIFNIYVSDIDSLRAIKLNGATLELDTLERIDGYYAIRVKLPSSMAAAKIPVVITLETASGNANGTYTLSLLKYARQVLASDHTESEEKLIKSVLLYVESAYAYFASADKVEVSREIREIIGEYEGELVRRDVSVNTAIGLSGAALILGAEPAIRFYLPEGASADAYKLMQGSVSVPYTTGAEEQNGKTVAYIDVSLYAYRMVDGIDYYINGVLAGTYHVNAYLDYVSSDSYVEADKSVLVDLVEKFYIYCTSAAEYRASVIGK